jgi:hypothetical protein
LSTIPSPVSTTGGLNSPLAQNILSIITTILQVLPSVIPGGAVAIALGATLIHALQAYEAQVGKPIDLTLIPQEAPVP